jgi:hypothetical protein
MIRSVTTEIRRRAGTPTKITTLSRSKILNRNIQSSRPSSGQSPSRVHQADISALINTTTVRVVGIQCPKKYIKRLEVHQRIII